MVFQSIFSLLFFFSVTTKASPAIDDLLKSYSLNSPGVSVLVAKKGAVFYQRSIGLANLQTKEEITEKSSFRLASVTKQFTAMAVMILKDRGLLSYDDKVISILPDFPHYGQKITVRHLLNHTSGLRKYERNVPSNQRGQLKDKDVLKILKSLSSLRFAPGSRYAYSNSGYAVLALVVEKVSGTSFSEFLSENIFRPLAMESTVAFEKEKHTIRKRVYGHSKVSSGFRRTDQNIFSAVLGDGGIYSSTEDYFKWDQALQRNQLVSRETKEEAFQKGQLSSGQRTSYGFGWRVGSFRGKRVLHHTGSSIGFKNISIHMPDDEISVVILSNRNTPHPKAIAFKILQVALNTQ